MRKIILILILIFGIMGSFSVFAHGVEEESKGKAILEKLGAKEANCQDLTDDDFEALGEYFMGQMVGTSHEAMNKMMTQMMGKEGEEKMHVVVGKRMSGCDLNAQMPENMMEDMMNGMMKEGTWSMRDMMGNFGVWSWLNWFGWILTILAWIALALGLIVLIKLLINKIKK